MGVRLARRNVAPPASSGRVSRAVGRGGGTTLPGKLLWKLDPGAIDALAARLPAGVAARLGDERQDDDRARCSPRILGAATGSRGTTPARTSPRASPPPCSRPRGAELGLLEVDEAALPEVMRRVRPRVVSLGNLFRDQLDRYGELEHIAERWRDAVADAPAETRRSSSTRDDPLRRRPRGRARRGRLRFGVDDPRLARPALQHAADSKHCLRCGSAVRLRRRVRRPPRRLPLPRLRPRPARARRRRPRVELHGLDALRVRPRHAGRDARASSCRSRASTTSTTRSRPRRSRSRSASSLDEIAAGLERFSAAFGRFERIAVGDRRALLLLIKNPAGANEAVRTLEDGGVPRDARRSRSTTRSPTAATSRGSGTSTSSRCSSGLETHRRRRGERAAELALRFNYGGLARRRSSRSMPIARAALDRGLELDAGRRRARRPPHLHGDARAARDRRRPRARAPVLGADA